MSFGRLYLGRGFGGMGSARGGNWWLPVADNIAAPIYADFSTEGTTNHYWADGAQRAGFDAWLTALSGTFTRASTKWVMGSAGLLVSVASGEIAIEYDINGDPIGALLEGARTNLALRSQEFSNVAWTPRQTTISANAVTGPDGTTTADTVSNNAIGSVGYHYIDQPITTVISTVYTQSYWVKKKTGSGIVWMLGQASSSFCYFNLNTGAVGTSTGWTNPKIEAFPDGWYRISAAQTASTTAYTPGIGVCLVNGTPNWDSTGLANTQEIYVWGAQFEVGAHASSYIPTTTGSVTRAADVPSFPWTDTTGTVYVQAKAPTAVSGLGSARAVGSNLAASPIFLGDISVVSTFNGSGILNRTGTGGSWTDGYKVATAGDPSGRSLTAGGLTVASDANPFFASAPSSLFLGSLNGASNFLFGHVTEFAAWPGTKLSDAALVELTS
jgi:hypothetical protein